MFRKLYRFTFIDCFIPGVEVIHIELGIHNFDFLNELKLLSLDEKSRASKFVCPAAMRQFVICRVFLRVLLASKLNCKMAEINFELGPYGRPHATLRGEKVSVSFNVSHSGAHGVVALAQVGEVGVDIEEVRPQPDWLSIATSAFAAEEVQHLRCQEPSKQIATFYRIWSLKEAVMKALGKGFYLNPRSFCLPPEVLYDSLHYEPIIFKFLDQSKPYNLQLTALPFRSDACLALAVVL